MTPTDTAAPTRTGNALELRAVRKVYEVGDDQVVALDHADLTVASDEIVALVGPSGSGKTTLCSIAGGLLSATAAASPSTWTTKAATESSANVRSGRLAAVTDRQVSSDPHSEVCPE